MQSDIFCKCPTKFEWLLCILEMGQKMACNKSLLMPGELRLYDNMSSFVLWEETCI